MKYGTRQQPHARTTERSATGYAGQMNSDKWGERFLTLVMILAAVVMFYGCAKGWFAQ